MVKQIPKKLLIHSIEHERLINDDGWDPEYEEPVTIKNVRVEATSRLQRGSDSQGEVVSHVVFVDRKHSSQFPNFNVGDRVTFNEISREVVDVKSFYAFGREIHHYELELR